MRSEIVLIGPPFAGKSTVGSLLSEALQIPQVSLDDRRWSYYREIGFDEELAAQIRQKGGFLALVLYWSQFNSHAATRLLSEHADCVFDFGAGPILFENNLLRQQLRAALAPFANVVRLLPSPDLQRSVTVLQQRASHLVGTNAQGFDWSAFFVYHEDNRRLAKHEVYTDGKTPAETCAQIMRLAR